MIRSRHPSVSRRFVKIDRATACQHEWVFTTPLHIKCVKCPAIGSRRPSNAERAEFKRGGWIFLVGA